MCEQVRGVLLVAHGSVIEGAERDLLQIAAFVRQASGARVVEVGFMSGTSPNISEAIASCVEQGVTELLAVPYFLSAGYLQQKALRQVELEAQRYPHLQIHSTAPLGPHPSLADVIVERANEALEKRRTE